MAVIVVMGGLASVAIPGQRHGVDRPGKGSKAMGPWSHGPLPEPWIGYWAKVGWVVAARKTLVLQIKHLGWFFSASPAHQGLSLI